MRKIVVLAFATIVSLGGITAASATEDMAQGTSLMMMHKRATSKMHMRHSSKMHIRSSSKMKRSRSGRGGGGMNPTPTRNDPPGTRKQCRGGCGGGN